MVRMRQREQQLVFVGRKKSFERMTRDQKRDGIIERLPQDLKSGPGILLPGENQRYHLAFLEELRAVPAHNNSCEASSNRKKSQIKPELEHV